MNLNIDSMNIDELKRLIKVLVENYIYEHDRLTTLQHRVLKLEMKREYE